MSRFNEQRLRVGVFLLMFIFITLTIIPNGAKSDEKVVYYYNTVIEGKFRDGSDFEISVFTKPNDGTKSCKDWFYIGTDGADPKNIVNNVSLSIDENKIIIPNSLVCDLANVRIQNGVWVMDDNATKLLYVEGGDGAGSYTAIFKFKDGLVKNRTLRSMNKFGELEDKVIIVE